jgi:hypothetical protein
MRDAKSTNRRRLLDQGPFVGRIASLCGCDGWQRAFVSLRPSFQLPTFLTTFDSGGGGGNLNQKNLL